jgi:hypothetical protein
MSRTPTSEDCAIITVIPVNSTVVTITTAEAAGRPERRGPAAGAAPIGHDLWILVRCTGAVGHLLLAEGPADDRAWDDHQAARTCSPPSGVCLWGVVLRHCQLIESDTVMRQVCYPGPPCFLGSPLCARDLGPTLESMAHFVTVRRR